jgi:hypothetical protein
MKLIDLGWALSRKRWPPTYLKIQAEPRKTMQIPAFLIIHNHFYNRYLGCGIYSSAQTNPTLELDFPFKQSFDIFAPHGLFLRIVEERKCCDGVERGVHKWRRDPRVV